MIFEPKTQNDLQNDQKSIGVFTKSWWRFTTSRNVEKALVLERFGASKKLFKIPYKTCRIPIILEPKTQIGLQNNQKALGFPLKVDGVSRPRKMLKKHWS